MSYFQQRFPGQIGVGDVSTDIANAVKSPAVATVSGAALVYHGYRRTGSIVWALLYGLAGRAAPVLAVPVALAQGFGKKRGCE